MKVLVLALAAPFIVAACSTVSDPRGPGSPSPSAGLTPSPSASPSAGLPDPGAVPAGLFAAILDDAAQKAGVEPSALTVVQAAAVTWSDGSLGCPEPGMMYTQALVPGYRVILEAAGTEYDYHVSERGQFTLCPPERAEDPIEGSTL